METGGFWEVGGSLRDPKHVGDRGCTDPLLTAPPTPSTSSRCAAWAGLSGRDAQASRGQASVAVVLHHLLRDLGQHALGQRRRGCLEGGTTQLPLGRSRWRSSVPATGLWPRPHPPEPGGDYPPPPEAHLGVGRDLLRMSATRGCTWVFPAPQARRRKVLTREARPPPWPRPHPHFPGKA